MNYLKVLSKSIIYVISLILIINIFVTIFSYFNLFNDNIIKFFKLVTPIIINNENPDEMPKLIRPTPIKIDKKDDAQNINKNIYNFKINENKTYNSESSCSYSK